MNRLIRKILIEMSDEKDFSWIEDIPYQYDSDVYNFLKENFKVSEIEMDSNIFGDGFVIKNLYGMDEYFNLTLGSKKTIHNKISIILLDEFPNISESTIRKTVRFFLNEIYN